MSWNFPEDSTGRMEAMMAYINFLKTEIEQLKKQVTVTPEAVLGGVGATLVSVNEFGDIGDGGGMEKCFEVGTTVSSISVGGSGAVVVTDGTTISTVYSPFGDIPANRAVAIAKDIDTDKWYIIAAKCS